MGPFFVVFRGLVLVLEESCYGKATKKPVGPWTVRHGAEGVPLGAGYARGSFPPSFSGCADVGVGRFQSEISLLVTV